ncbi:MAG: hypothetical protein ACFHX7_07130 [Pseudomonadota bacterium]
MFASLLPVALVVLMLVGVGAFAFMQQRPATVSRVRANCVRLPDEDSEF